MHPLTFTCLHCNNLMAVGPELYGQQVRCPTCGQIVQAPTAATEPTYVLEPAPMQPSDGDTMDDVPELRLPVQTEPPESIFSSEHGEDIFGEPPPKLDFPMETAPPPSANGSSHTGFAPYPPPETLTVPPPSPVDSPSSVAVVPPGPIEGPLLPEETAEMPALPSMAQEAPTWQAVAPAAEAEWQPAEDAPSSSEPTPVSDDMSGSVLAEHAVAAAGEMPQRRLHSAERKEQRSRALVFLGPYAAISTLLAAWFAYQYYTVRSMHPLENIPDVIGAYDAAHRDPLKTSERTIKLPAPDQALPDKLKVALGQTLQIGDLEVKPLRVEEGRFQYTTDFKSGSKETKTTGHPALILHLRLKNTSSDVVFHPTDPFFLRQYIEGEHRSKPYMFVEVGDKRHYGGPFNYLGFRRDPKNPRLRMFAEGQENDDRPLLPGEERETRIYTFPDPEGRLIDAVHKAKEPIVWRIQLRRGLMAWKNREFSMSAVVGVTFSAADVRKVH